MIEVTEPSGRAIAGFIGFDLSRDRIWISSPRRFSLGEVVALRIVERDVEFVALATAAGRVGAATCFYVGDWHRLGEPSETPN